MVTCRAGLKNLVERFPNTFTTIASEVIKSASASSSTAKGFESVNGNHVGPNLEGSVKLSQTA